MSMATTRPSPGYQRTASRSRATPTSRSAPPAAASFAAAPRVTVAAPASPLKDISDVLLGSSLLVGVAVGLMLLGLYTRDSMAVGKALSEQGSATSSMVCKEGRIARGDGSLPDRVFEDGIFVCTDWRTQQALEMEASQRWGGRRN